MPAPEWEKGPWRLVVEGEGGGQQCYIVAASPNNVTVSAFDKRTKAYTSWSHTHDSIVLRSGGAYAGRHSSTDLANARLASKSPELYAMLELLLQNMRQHPEINIQRFLRAWHNYPDRPEETTETLIERLLAAARGEI